MLLHVKKYSIVSLYIPKCIPISFVAQIDVLFRITISLEYIYMYSFCVPISQEQQEAFV